MLYLFVSQNWSVNHESVIHDFESSMGFLRFLPFHKTFKTYIFVNSVKFEICKMVIFEKFKMMKVFILKCTLSNLLSTGVP